MMQEAKLHSHRRAMAIAASLALAVLLGGCAVAPRDAAQAEPSMPLRHGWYDGQDVLYLTTDVSDAEVAKAKGANFVPQLAYTIPTAATRAAGQKSAVDKVYAVVHPAQPSVFASAPEPVGAANRDAAYTPLWQMVKVTWKAPAEARLLRSEEEVLAAAEAGQVVLETTRVILNCPIVHRGSKGGLPGISIGAGTP